MFNCLLTLKNLVENSEKFLILLKCVARFHLTFSYEKDIMLIMKMKFEYVVIIEIK